MGKMRAGNSKPTGFSLIAVLIVMGIMALLIGISTLAFSTWTTRYDIERQVKMLHADLLKTRAEAMNKNRAHFVVLKKNSYSIIADTHPSPDGDGEKSVADDVVLPDTALRHPLDSASTITFDTRGMVPLSQSRTICVSSNVNPDFDCIKVSRTRILMGKILKQGQPCDHDNCKGK